MAGGWAGWPRWRAVFILPVLGRVSPHLAGLTLLLLRLLAPLEQFSMERKSSLTVQLQRNEKLVKLIIISLLGVLIICYCLQVVMFLIPIIYPGYNTVKTIQVLTFLLSALPENVTLQTDSVRLRRRWLSYWLIYSSISMTEQLLFMLSWLLPLYSLARTLLLLWCLAPVQYNGADIIYNIIRPLLPLNPARTK